MFQDSPRMFRAPRRASSPAKRSFRTSSGKPEMDAIRGQEKPAAFRLRLELLPILDADLDLVGVALQLRCVHRIRTRRQRTERTRNLGTHLVADAVLATRQMPHKERYFLVTQFHVCA